MVFIISGNHVHWPEYAEGAAERDGGLRAVGGDREQTLHHAPREEHHRQPAERAGLRRQTGNCLWSMMVRIVLFSSERSDDFMR